MKKTTRAQRGEHFSSQVLGSKIGAKGAERKPQAKKLRGHTRNAIGFYLSRQGLHAIRHQLCCFVSLRQ